LVGSRVTAAGVDCCACEPADVASSVSVATSQAVVLNDLFT
jgi:hypothetical protein